MFSGWFTFHCTVCLDGFIVSRCPYFRGLNVLVGGTMDKCLVSFYDASTLCIYACMDGCMCVRNYACVHVYVCM